MHVFNVSSLNEQIKTLLEESFNRVLVEGEISRVTLHTSGHLYFTLKDAESAIKCVMFRGNASKLKFRLEEGLMVVLDGALSLYKPRGEYQINCFSIQPSGHGALALAFEQLKSRLSAKGYFDPARKKELPKFPKKIAFITSATGAALQDMLRVAQNRYRVLEIDIYDVLVQGDRAAASIVRAIEYADTKGYDLMITGRGGGSIEDLWAFNEERVAEVIFQAKTPIISAVGHEIDWVMSDFVADLRAPTPSAAVQAALPDTNELYQYIDSLMTQYKQRMTQKVYTLHQELAHMKNLYAQHSIESKTVQKIQEISQLHNAYNQIISLRLEHFSKEIGIVKERLPHAIESRFQIAQNQVVYLEKMLESNHPKYKSKKGFAQISKDAKVVDLSSLKVDDNFELMNDRVIIHAKVLEKKEYKGV